MLQVEIDLSSLGIFSTAVAAVFSKLGVPIKTTVAPMVHSLSGADSSLSHSQSAAKAWPAKPDWLHGPETRNAGLDTQSQSAECKQTSDMRKSSAM